MSGPADLAKAIAYAQQVDLDGLAAALWEASNRDLHRDRWSFFDQHPDLTEHHLPEHGITWIRPSYNQLAPSVKATYQRQAAAAIAWMAGRR